MSGMNKIKFNSPIETEEILITGKLDVRGESTVTSLEETVTSQNTIKLRENAQGALGAEEYAGFVINNYDGNNHNSLIALSGEGTLYIGD
jgi:hypothetical protein